MKNSNDTIGNRTRDLPACSALPQPTASPRASIVYCVFNNIKVNGGRKVTCAVHVGHWVQLQYVVYRVLRFALQKSWLVDRVGDWA